jgi:hypothetical protein
LFSLKMAGEVLLTIGLWDIEDKRTGQKQS